MPLNFDDIVQDCVEKSGPGTGGIDIAEVLPRVWEAFVRHVAKTLRTGRGVIIPRFAKITFMKTTGKPIFDVSEQFLRSYGITMKKPPVALQAVAMEVNFSRVAHDARVAKDFASTVVDTVIRRLGEIAGDGDEAIYASFGTIGTIFAEGRTMGFRFAREKRQRAARSGGGNSAATFTAKAPLTAAGLSLSGAAAGPSAASARAPSRARPEAEPEPEQELEPEQRGGGGGGGGGGKSNRGSSSRSGRAGAGLSEVEERRQNASSLQQSHLTMMRQKREAQAQEQAAEQERYAQSMRDLRAAEQARQSERTKRQQEMRDVAQAQRDQAQDNMDRTLAERAAEVNADGEPWPFKTDQQVKEHKRDLDADFRQGLDKQMLSARRRRGGGEGDTEGAADTRQPKSRVAPIHNVFPRFLEPQREVSRAHFVPQELYSQNMRQSWDALHIAMEDEERNISSQKQDARRRRERAELLHQKQAIERRRERAELNEFLRNQARLKQKLDHDAEHELFYGKDPDPGQAYPVEKKRNIEKEQHIKAKLKRALDLQVADKQARSSEERRQQMQEDNFFVDCVQHALRNDRAYRCKKVANDRLMLTTQWQAQKDAMKRQRDLTRARDNIAIVGSGGGD